MSKNIKQNVLSIIMVMVLVYPLLKLLNTDICEIGDVLYPSLGALLGLIVLKIIVDND